MALSDEFLDDLRRRADIESTVSSYVSLKRKGKILTDFVRFTTKRHRRLPYIPKRSRIIASGAATAETL